MGEIARGQEVVEYACGIPHLVKGGYTENASTKIDVHSIRQPLGVAAIISPFNFPAMVPMWFFPIAIAAGNTVVLKPSEKDPTAANWMAELWKEAGLPDGVFNVVHGDKEAVDTLLTDPRVASVSFVGSTPIAQYVYATGTATASASRPWAEPRTTCWSSPTPTWTWPPTPPSTPASAPRANAAWPSPRSSPSTRSPTNWSPRSPSAPATLRVGDGTRGCDMGPLVTAAHRDKVAGYIDAGEAAGATMVLDGRSVNPDAEGEGFFLNPTLFDNVTTDMSIYTDEIFGPVLSVVRVDSFDEGIETINANPYGNGTAIFTNDGGAARRFENEIQVGMVGINVPIPVPMAYYSFGGWKNSLFGDTHAYGAEGINFFTRGKVVTSRWLDPSHGGLNLGFPQNA